MVSKKSIMVILSWITSRILFLLPSWIPVLTVLVGHLSNTAFLCQNIKVLAAQSYPTFCNPMDCSPPGSSAHGILQARILEWVAILPPGELPNPGIRTWSLKSPALAGRFFTTSATWETPIYLEHGSSHSRHSTDNSWIHRMFSGGTVPFSFNISS